MRLVADGTKTRVTRAGRAAGIHIENTGHDHEWDSFVECVPGGDLVQASAWARIKRHTGSRAERIVVRDAAGEIMAGVQMLVRRVRGIGAVGYAPYGPLAVPGTPNEVVDPLAAQMIESARDNNIRALFVQPPMHGARIAARLHAAGFEPSDADVAPSATLRIDVRVSNDELLARMARHTRADMRRSMRQPLRVRMGTRDDLPSFAELHADSAVRQGFAPTPLPYLEMLWDELATSGHVVLFVVDTDGVDLAAMLLTRFGDHLCNRLSGFAPERLPARLRANEYLKWAAISWARHRRIPWFDLGGVDRSIAIALASGVDRDLPELHDGPWGHKVVLGGTPVILPEPMQFVPNRVLRVGYRALRTSKTARGIVRSTQRTLRVASATPRGGGA